MEIMLDSSLDSLKNAPVGLKTLSGCHTYDMLANPLYIEQFQYVSAAVENRAEYIFDDNAEEGDDAAQSDIVRVVLNLAFLHNPLDFKFQADQLKKLKEEHASHHDAEKGHGLN